MVENSIMNKLCGFQINVHPMKYQCSILDFGVVALRVQRACDNEVQHG
jgi:hypothetical protein